MNEQERFWRGDFGDGYAQRNVGYDPALEEKAWRTMTRSLPAEMWQSALECGCNRGRNLLTLKRLRPELTVGLIEIHPGSYQQAVAAVKPTWSFNGPILDAPAPTAPFDVVFTCGVLIHISPDELLANLTKAFSFSGRYLLVGEYFNRTPVSIDYHGESNKLFKRDFGGFVLDHFPVDCLDYGFLWGREYDPAGFDDITWWLFRKQDK